MNQWLPAYATTGLGFEANEKTLIATLYEAGTVIGALSVGALSDGLLFGRRSPLIVCALVLATVGHVVLLFLGGEQKNAMFALLFLLGMTVGGPANLVSTTATTDLGKREELKNNEKAVSTVAGIVDGFGSVGSAIGQLVIGVISESSWSGVFGYLTAMCALSTVPLSMIALREFREVLDLGCGKKKMLNDITEDEENEAYA